MERDGVGLFKIAFIKEALFLPNPHNQLPLQMNKYIRQIGQKHLQKKKIAHRINFLHITDMTKLVISDGYQTIIIGSSLSEDNHRTIKGSSLLNLLLLPFWIFLQKLQCINTTKGSSKRLQKSCPQSK